MKRALSLLAAVLVAPAVTAAEERSAAAPDAPATVERDAESTRPDRTPSEAIDHAKDATNAAIEAAKRAILRAIDEAKVNTSEKLEEGKQASEDALDEAHDATRLLDKAAEAARDVLEKAKQATTEVFNKAKEAADEFNEGRKSSDATPPSDDAPGGAPSDKGPSEKPEPLPESQTWH